MTLVPATPDFRSRSRYAVSMLGTRIFFGLLMIAALVGLIWLDDHLAESLASDFTPGFLVNVNAILLDGGLVCLVLLALTVIAVRELHRLLVAAGHAPLLIWPGIVCLGLVTTPYLVKHAVTAQISQDLATDYEYTVNWIVAALVGTCLLVMARRRAAGSAAAIAASLFIVAYAGLLAQYIMRLRMAAPSGAAWLLLYYIGTVKICDIGAYFTGYSIGRHKLIEWLSPKKTIEGLAGGVAASMAFAVAIPAAVRSWGSHRLWTLFPEWKTAVLFGAMMALIGQAGDLVESLLKRDAQLKDSAAAVPAFGGVLDILDSLLLTAPFAFWLLLK